MTQRLILAVSAVALCLSFAGCKKHVATTKTPPPPPPSSAPANNSTPSASTPDRTRDTATTQTAQSRMPDAATRARIQDLLNRIQDAYFDYNKHTLRPDAETALKADVQTLAEIIKQYPDFHLTIEGHCDERGSEEYNLALGEARAKQAKEYMASLGLPADQLKIVSYGKERPFCTEHTEDCYQKNRVAHITQAQ